MNSRAERPLTVDEVRPLLFTALPRLRAFAISLTGETERADDLVQDAIVRALGHLDQFEPGSNFQGWMFTILRNQFHTIYRKRRREVEDPHGAYAEKLAVAPEQGAYLDFSDMQKALAQLSPEQREAIILVAADGVSYEEAAKICGAKLGTIKSRVNRARKRLEELLGCEGAQEVGPPSTVLAVLADRAEATLVHASPA